MRKFDVELAVGFFLLIGIICLGYLSFKLGKMEIVGTKGYDITAVFSDSGGLKVGSGIVIAGVDVGRVRDVTLDNYQARVVMRFPTAVKIQEDSIASIRTKGLIGEKFVEITPGGSEKTIPPGGKIRDTQPAVNLEDLISKYIFGKI
jgi:phospholipid/cholesterol/gamma-HCH transport system substrate-binding protein